jgi:hypothetical protein
VFEGVGDGELIDVMGEATRDESTAIALGQPTGELPPTVVEEPSGYRALMMPRRKHTREQNRQQRINAERRQRTELIAEEERQRQAWLAANYQPPPF